MAIIGAWEDDANKGSAYLFDVTTGQQLTKLVASDREKHSSFGFSVAISDQAAIVGAYRTHDDNSGAAYLYDVNTGQELFKITLPEGTPYTEFGRSVDIDDDVAIVGAHYHGNDAGAAYLFDAKTGQQIHELVSPLVNGGDSFGQSVGISDNIAVVSAVGDDEAEPEAGAVFLFDVSTGQRTNKLIASDASNNDMFGWSLAVNNSHVIVGARADNEARGSAYIFAVPEPSSFTLVIFPLFLALSRKLPESKRCIKATGRKNIDIHEETIHHNARTIHEYPDFGSEN